MPSDRRLLTHFLSAIAYRTQKALRDAPEGFGAFRASPGVRTPHQIVQHMSDVLGFALGVVSEGELSRAHTLPTFDTEVARLHDVLRGLTSALASAPDRAVSSDRLLQGPLADAMTHVGQLALLRRLAGSPVPPENFSEADIRAGNVGPDQTLPRSPSEPWFTAEDEPS